MSRLYPRRLHCVLPEPMDAATIRETLEETIRRRRVVHPCAHAEACVCRRSSTAGRYGRTRPPSVHVKVRVTDALADRLAALAGAAGVSIGQAVRDLLGV